MGYIDAVLVTLKGKGQISPNEAIYKHIVSAVSDPLVKTVVEIGTFNGMGSSRAIREGLRLNKSAYAIGYEATSQFSIIARVASIFSPRFKVVRGTLISSTDLDELNVTSVESDWLARDHKVIDALVKKQGVSKVPFEKIDLLVSDGGEFSGFAEFKILESLLTKYLILDDVNTRKNSETLNYLSSSKEWELIDKSNERHGTAFLKKINHLNS